jgi:hypothetical protein
MGLARAESSAITLQRPIRCELIADHLNDAAPVSVNRRLTRVSSTRVHDGPPSRTCSTNYVTLFLSVRVGVAVPMLGVELPVDADWHPFNAAETPVMRQSIVT